YGCSGVAFSRS
ncbi:SOS mutagenesis and repair protein UmuC, partial [Escherichia coli EC1865]